MKSGASQRQRRSMRLRDYDYASPGVYFVTICTHGGECLLGDVVGGYVQLNNCGQAVQACWGDLPKHYPHVRLDALVIMPNHVHGIIVLVDDTGAGLRPAPTRPAPAGTKRHGLPEIVCALKSFSARRINQLRNTPGQPVWQRNYYEHVVRDEDELYHIRRYIAENPLKWELDEENPAQRAERQVSRLNQE